MKTVIKPIFTLSLAIVLCSMVQAQNFTNNDKKVISNAVDSVLKLYETYSTFTEDDMEISLYYAKKFVEIFQSDRSLINMDLIPEATHSTNVRKYVRYVKENFPEGFGVKISDIRLSKPGKSASGGYEVKVRLTKQVYGYRESGKKHENNLTLVMTFGFNNPGGPFKIVSLLDEKQDGRLVNQKKTNELSLSVIPVYTSFFLKNSDLKNLSSAGNFSLQLNINYFKYFQIKKGLYYGAGLTLGLSEYHATISFDQYEQPESDNFITDSDNDTLKYAVNFGSVSEEMSVTFYDIILWPVRIRHLNINSNFEFFYGLGIKFSIPFKSESFITGSDTTIGNYSNIPLKLDDVDYYGYGPQQIDKAGTTLDSSFASLNVMGVINGGVSYTIGRNLSVGLAFNFDFSFSNLTGESSPFLAYRNDKETNNNYNSILSVSNSSKPYSLGLLVNLTYRF